MSKDKTGKQYMKLDFYKYLLKAYPIPMNINLYFDKMPDTAKYYLCIPEFKQGSTTNATVPQKLDNRITIDICCKGKPLINNRTGVSWPPVFGYDITEIVFPGVKKKKN